MMINPLNAICVQSGIPNSNLQQESIDEPIVAARLHEMDIKEYLKEMGRKGGKARAAKLTPEEKTRIALQGVFMKQYLKNLKKKSTWRLGKTLYIEGRNENRPNSGRHTSQCDHW